MLSRRQTGGINFCYLKFLIPKLPDSNFRVVLMPTPTYRYQDSNFIIFILYNNLASNF
jgi:hypothetical protein